MTRWLLVLAAVGALLGSWPTRALALSSAGEAVVVDASGQPLRRGTTATEFTLRLPEGAECQGDSQDGNYRVQSFFVPPTFDPSTLTYQLDAPDGEGNQPLWDIYTNPYTQGLTGVAKEKGGPGPVTNTPLFSFAVYTPRLDLIPSGRYRTGLACTLRNKTMRFWETEITVVTNPSLPVARQISWSVDSTPAKQASSNRAPVVMVGVVGVALVGGFSVSRARRRSS